MTGVALYLRNSLGPGRDQFQRRLKVIWIGVICGLVLLLIRVGWLQLIKGERYLHLSKTHCFRLVPLPAPRGLILDRAGRILADNRASFSLAVVPRNIREVDSLLEALKKVVSLDIDRVKEKIKKAPNPYRPVVLKENIDLALITCLLEREEEFPGVIILDHPARNYPQGRLTSHLLGYLGEVSAAELNTRSNPTLEPGDMVGKMGIETVHNSYLLGRKGARQVEVDVMGRQLRTILEKDPTPGDNVYLTLNLRMQEIAEEEFGERTGVVLIGDPFTGEVLALLSHPCFDPNWFIRGISQEEWNKLREDPTHPLENRAIRGEYPPASTFKIVMASAALEEKLADEKTTFLCPGEYRIGDRVIKCWKKEGHGVIDLEQALVHSCNIFFCQLGIQVGVSRIIEFARRFGLGKPTGIDLLSEKEGLLPTPAWKRNREGETWYPGDTANLSIGQGYVLVTPVQMLNLISALANGGLLLRPYLVRRIADFKGDTIVEFSPHRIKNVHLSSETVSFLRGALRGVVQEGPGWRANNQVVSISGKTGTAQLAGEQPPHNWFVGYAPSDNPSLTIVVLVEHREEEIAIAPEIAGKILTQIFEEKLVPVGKDKVMQ